MSDCLFCRIRDGAIPAKIVAESANALAFRDISPQAPIHVLVIPRKHIPSLADAADEDAAVIGEMHLLAQKIARDEHLDEGYRTVMNTGKHGGQTVHHLHLHLLGGRHHTWPPG
jgi:histidine triad (HIT) family protein